MKAFFVILLAAVAYAEPEAEADPALLYRGLYGAALPYSAYSYGYRYPSALGYRLASPYYRRYLYKREAESEPEAEADPALLYANTLPYATTYAHAAYAAAPVAAVAPAVHTVAAPAVHTVAAPVITKTVAAPVVTKTVAAAPAVHTVATAPAYTTYAAHAVASPVVYNTAPVVHNIVKPVSYYANSAGVEHVVAKREAEADAWAPYYNRYAYGLRYPYARRAYGYGYRWW